MVYVPLKHFTSKNAKKFNTLTTELFGPFSLVTNYSTKDIPKVKEVLERMKQNLTAGLVSNDILFNQEILGSTVKEQPTWARRQKLQELLRTTGSDQAEILEVLELELMKQSSSYGRIRGKSYTTLDLFMEPG
eukprot:CAMPEP_0202961056 /NCGR_PEP_ID=MMETSP1396-20130829/5152_1 /ASSEMBLY_ACC=CAM_ASM_000872 /TAXON_ID= /ORGANISM="Pseudokeronopsis sp., Strain Brazil" /LENGTH=132 /DNA_ID=CAMNT_0049680641 /DNA_START=1245 /DNA_END=1644 /DNA_ORIENTATION=+